MFDLFIWMFYPPINHLSGKTKFSGKFEDRAALMPLPSTTFDTIRWESRRADKYGQIDIDSNRYLAGPALHGRRLLAAVRWDSVQITDPGTGRCV